MEKLIFTGVRLPNTYIKRLRKIKETKYIGISEQIRIALRLYFKSFDKK